MNALPKSNTDWLQGTGLIELVAGPLPVIKKSLWGELQEWLVSWRHADALRKAGLMAPGALLLYGPPGSGKSSLCAALLKHLPGRDGCVMETFNMIVGLHGESERNIARAFDVAERRGALLVIEEIDALGGDRRDVRSNLAEAERRQTITLMRHIERSQAPIIATTNYQEALDPALKRRFEKCLEVPLVDEAGRAGVLKKIIGRDAPAELVMMPLVESIRIAHRMRRLEFIQELEGRAK